MSIIVVRATDGSGTLQLRQAGPGQRSGGVGGWEPFARSRRTEAVEWIGTPGLQWVVPLVLGDGSAGIEPDIKRLEGWGRPRSKGRDPVRVKLSGPVPFSTDLQWVINDLVLDDDGLLMRNADGRRTQQRITVTFREYVEASVVRGPASKSKAGR